MIACETDLSTFPVSTMKMGGRDGKLTDGAVEEFGNAKPADRYGVKSSAAA
jgi:hypothetical protein